MTLNITIYDRDLDKNESYMVDVRNIERDNDELVTLYGKSPEGLDRQVIMTQDLIDRLKTI